MSEAISRKLRPETRQRLAKAAIALLFALIFLLGLCTVDDYGRNWDEKGEINIYRMALMEYGELLPFETGFHQALKAMGVIPLSQSIEMDHNSSAYYPLAPLACDPNVTDQQFTHWWRVWTWALFTLGLYALYAVCRRMGLSRPLAAAAALLALCCPRLFAQGHYNNKDAALMDLAAVVRPCRPCACGKSPRRAGRCAASRWRRVSAPIPASSAGRSAFFAAAWPFCR